MNAIIVALEPCSAQLIPSVSVVVVVPSFVFYYTIILLLIQVFLSLIMYVWVY